MYLLKQTNQFLLSFIYIVQYPAGKKKPDPDPTLKYNLDPDPFVKKNRIQIKRWKNTQIQQHWILNDPANISL